VVLLLLAPHLHLRLAERNGAGALGLRRVPGGQGGEHEVSQKNSLNDNPLSNAIRLEGVRDLQHKTDSIMGF
jgi:hypothetical protein